MSGTTETIPASPPGSIRRGVSRPALWCAVISVFLVGLNLRPAITSVGFVAPAIQSEFSLNATLTGLVTTIPLLAFVVLSTRAPGWGHRVGLARMIGLALVVLAAGFLTRMIPSAAALFIGMAIVGVAITIGNVLLPAYIKQRYADKSGVLMAAYTVSLYAGPALASAGTLPLVQVTGSWQLALLAWGVLILMALPLWVPHLRGGATTGGRGRPRRNTVWAHPLAWAVAVYFAVLSVLFYTVGAWLPTMLLDRGFDADLGAVLLTIVNGTAVPFALGVSVLVHRIRSQVGVALFGVVCLGLGLAGMFFGPEAMVITASVLFGVGHGTATGVAFSLAMLRTRTAAGTAALGGMSQAAGYLLSATGPIGAGLLHDIAGSWVPVMTALVGLTVVQLIAGIFAGRDVYIDETTGTGGQKAQPLS